MSSIRRQLTRNLLAATLLLLGGGLLAVYLLAREMVFEQFDATLRAKAFAISTLTRVGAGGVSVDFTDRFLRGFDADKPRDFFQLWDEQGRTLARSESLKKRGDLPRRFGKVQKPERWNFPLPTGRPGRAVGFAFKPRTDETRASDSAPAVWLVVATDREDLEEVLWGLLGLSAGCAVLLIAATLWLIPRVLRSGLRPLDQLGDQAARINAESLAARFPTGEFPVELQPIAGRLNELLARLEQSFERERRFSADLAHELRTPIAELRSAAECALKWPDARDPATDRDTLVIAQQMEALVARMLALTRGEQTQIAVAAEPVALEPLVREVWRTFAARAAERRLAVSFALAPLIANADAALLRSVVTNLCDNAADYAPSDGEVRFSLEDQDGRVSLQVANPAPDLEAGDVDRLFDRFWRKEAARSDHGHVGLGLALARAFAAAMGWALTARLDERGWLVLSLTSPQVSPPVMLG